MVAVKLLRICAKKITGTFPANVTDSVPKVSILAEFTVVSHGIEQTFQADARTRVTVACVVKVPVLATVAAHTRPSRYLWISVKVVGTVLTLIPCKKPGDNVVVKNKCTLMPYLNTPSDTRTRARCW